MPIAWGEAIANRVREYDGTRSTSSFIRQIKAAFKGVSIDPLSPDQWISAIELRIAQNITNVIEAEDNIIVIFEKANKATQEDVKTMTNFLEERFPVIGSTTTKALANMQIKELAQKKDESINDYYRRS